MWVSYVNGTPKMSQIGSPYLWESPLYLDSIPYKYPSHQVNYNVFIICRCSVTFIDFEGRSDGESIKKLITQVKPRQLVRFE